VVAKVAKILHGAFGERMSPPGSFDKILADGRLGRKAKKGFYVYADEKTKGPKRVDETVYDLTPHGRKRTPLDAAEAVERCVLQMVNEAALCLGEGILRSARDGDIGAVFGLGFPPFRGGPFRYADTLGLQTVVGKMQRWQDKFGVRFKPAPLLVEMAANGKAFFPR
jgi:3-hydroxyacyl-CoA dehydrogenase/enoyl-CoA hydratase/3-hydroxybutyryl-CoA epimerase